MSTGYASGKWAIGMCQRCGFVYKLAALRPDGETNLLVCRTCYDIPHPAEEPLDATDSTTLRRPAPDLDETDSRVLEDDTPLGELLFGAGNYFGEQS